MSDIRDLIFFQKADELAFQIYQITASFPKDELYGLTSQMRRAAVSIPANIVEGHARKSKKEFKQFINIALGSLAEARYFFHFSKRLGYHKKDHTSTAKLFEETSKVLWSFYRKL
jgi:four helix bundle protein